jgi:putative methyltransferase (TIGR04325 family)
MSPYTSLKPIIRRVMPPIVLDAVRSLHTGLRGAYISTSVVEWEHIPEGWAYAAAHSEVHGWNVTSILEIYKAKWPSFVARLKGSGPLGVAHESALSTSEDINSHNTTMTFAYALALAARDKQALSVLDWGGGIGHYCLLASAVLPGVPIEYHCKDVSILAEHGQQLFPDQYFYSDESCLQRSYDFVLASSSLHFAEDWDRVLAALAGATGGYLLVTRLPTVIHVPSYVFIQRPYAYGYNTEYLGWCIKKVDLIQVAARVGLRLVREFVIGERPNIVGAPEACQYRGFLFRRES